jgi:gamma-glutamyltranspeptidase/glutathione hydrolase
MNISEGGNTWKDQSLVTEARANMFITQEPDAPWMQYEICSRPNNGKGTAVGFFEKRWNGPIAYYENQGVDKPIPSFDALSSGVVAQTDNAMTYTVPGGKGFLSFTSGSWWRTVSMFAYTAFKTITLLVRPSANLAASSQASIFSHISPSVELAVLHLATDDFKQDKGLSKIFLHHGEPFKEGDRLIQSDLGETLERIKRNGSDGFYKGITAKEFVNASRDGGGMITDEDLNQYETRVLPPVECNYRGYHIISAPPPSSGGVILCEMLKILEAYSLKSYGFNSAQTVHVMVEAMRHAYQDRNTLLGDPAFIDNPIDYLLSQKHIDDLRNQIQDSMATPSISPNTITEWNEGLNTTHFSVVDRWGNAVSMTYTLNAWFGARVLAGKTGVILNDEMDDFTIKLGEPNQFKLIQGKANQIQPGKRPLSSMTPTIVTKDGEVVMILGTPGGSRIITAVLQTLVNVIDFDMNIQEAVDAPRFHHQWLPDQIIAENRSLSFDTTKLLQSWGYHIVSSAQANHMAAIYVNTMQMGESGLSSKRFSGANDSRKRTGLALGY